MDDTIIIKNGKLEIIDLIQTKKIGYCNVEYYIKYSNNETVGPFYLPEADFLIRTKALNISKKYNIPLMVIEDLVKDVKNSKKIEYVV